LKKSITGGIILLFLLVSIFLMAYSISSSYNNIIYVNNGGGAFYTKIHYKIENGSLSGFVNDSFFNPIEGALISIKCGEIHMQNISDSTGFYYIDNVPIVDCYWNLSASKKGYEPFWIEMSIDINSTYDFVLRPFGKTLYVGGSGIGNYTTIQSAIDNASDGDTVFVYSGTYYENVIVYKSICLIGEKKNSTIIDGSMNKEKDVICFTASHADIEKFTIKNGKNGILTDGDYGVVDNLNIVENIIIDNIRYGVFFFGSGYNNVLGNIITNNIYGIKAYEFCSNIIFGNIISSSSEAGIHLTSAVNAGNCMNNTISFNTLQNNGEGIILFTSYNNKINNNNFYGNSKDASFVWSNSNNWNYNYWNRPRILPKPVIGIILFYLPWINFDWHPAQEPYDISYIL